MNMGLRIVVIVSGLLLFTVLRVASALRLDRALLARLAGRRASAEPRLPLR